MLNWILIVLLACAAIVGAYTGRMEAVTKAGIDSAKTAVELAIGLIGQMAIWLGMMRVLQDGGALASLSRVMTRILQKPLPFIGPLFPGIPVGHPAMAAMVLNIAANMLGLTNAATPFGLKAMKALDELNTKKGVATDSMALFLAINTSGVAVMPLGVVAIRGMMGTKDPAGIFLPSMIATACSTFVAIMIAKSLERNKRFRFDNYQGEAQIVEEPKVAEIKGIDDAEEMAAVTAEVTGWRQFVMPVFALVVAGALALEIINKPADQTAFELFRTILSQWILPILMAAIVLYGLSRKVRVYESIVTGAKEGFDIAVMIIPFLVAILVAIGAFRASGSLDVIVSALRPATDLLGFPADALPMALIRPLSGSGALTVLMDTLNTHGKDSFVGFVASVMSGSTETTFYVLALYFGSVQIRSARHTVWACLAADFTGIIAAVLISRIWWL